MNGENRLTIQNELSNEDVKKFNKEYPILKVSKTNKFHDIFIIVDNKYII